MTLAASLMFATMAPATAQANDNEITPKEVSLSAELSSGSSESSESDAEENTAGVTGLSSLSSAGSSGNQAGSLLAGVAVIAAVAGMAGAGITWAVQERLITNPLPGIIPSPSPAPAPAPAPQQAAPAPATNVYYQNCAAVWNAINRPIYRSDPGYRSTHDQDNDGVGCENDPR